jgi:hypothetical protein
MADAARADRPIELCEIKIDFELFDYSLDGYLHWYASDQICNNAHLILFAMVGVE